MSDLYRMSEEEVIDLARRAYASPAGEALRAREGRWILLARLSGKGTWDELGLSIADAPDGGAAMAQAAHADLTEEESEILGQAVSKSVMGLLLLAADDARAAAESMLVDPRGIEPDAVALIAAGEALRLFALNQREEGS